MIIVVEENGTNVRVASDLQPSKEVVMRNLESIIREYREADSDRRLHLFLDCPSLRNEFVEIELHSGTQEKRSIFGDGSTRPSVWRRMFSYAHLV